MQGAWNNDKATYRCKHADDQALDQGAPHTVCVKEESILTHLPALLIRLGLRPERTAADRQEATIEEAVSMLRDNEIRLTYDHAERMITATDEKGETVKVKMGQP